MWAHADLRGRQRKKLSEWQKEWQLQPQHTPEADAPPKPLQQQQAEDEERMADEMLIMEKKEKNENVKNEAEEVEDEMAPQPRKKKLLVLDLDKTLICTSDEVCFVFEIVMINGRLCNGSVKPRPFLEEFLECCSKYYEILMFTSAGASYVERVLNLVDKKSYLSRRIYRNMDDRSIYKKDISNLGWSLNDIILIDDSSNVCKFFPKNSIKIGRYTGADDDIALLQVLPVLLTTLAGADNVRHILDSSKPFSWICEQVDFDSDEQEQFCVYLFKKWKIKERKKKKERTGGRYGKYFVND
ncbi:hypothetical protein RFI_26136 [Reticulomyxa filosa]|uniref:Mitochondrial import inner membrane translocase subunit TIM50 n=1 Tax=Reticulomyxa filosa TaxID=46433 RepID=X6MDX4_RETFI|nr:hypothetical protein RFI_26136 [Reticulomyxa filosa]|eukprot:ETO11240.1 hypothetical protein RFI_26136 [Reticulomyxa filosa]